jgi:mRNA interferase RelE/StbE
MRPVVFTPSAARQWRKLSGDIRARIDAKVSDFAATGQGDVKRLKGRTGARLRVGDWRVILYEDGAAIVIAAVGHRREIH